MQYEINRILRVDIMSTMSLTTTQISELISKRSKGQIYKISATLRDSLERRLKREGYVEGIEMNNKGLYSITPKGQKNCYRDGLLFYQLIHKFSEFNVVLVEIVTLS
jgi:DNA-binding PadR family transcriptional regulator